MSEPVDRWAEIVKVVYGGVDGGMPETDEQQLRAVADWLDRIDDAADAALAGRGVIDRKGSIQESLRAIADRLSSRDAGVA